MSDRFLAHVKQDNNGEWCVHHLEEHLRKVAALAEKFGKKFDSDQWAKLAGLWHDLGKYRPAFQAHIKKSSGCDPDAHISSENNPKTAHASTGAIYAKEKLGNYGLILSYLIAGHHAGLPDFTKDDAAGSALSEILIKDKLLLSEALDQEIPADILTGDLPINKPQGSPDECHLWIRMLFSCLVDADFLDTESFMSPDKTLARQNNLITFEQMLTCFNQHMWSLQKRAKPSKVNDIRAKILDSCRVKAQEATGVYTMTVPTGGGKTLSSLAFSLEHAVKHNKSRIIYAIPYTSIIEQTANIFRDIFNSVGDVLIEHHSNAEPRNEKDENHWSRLATENWDAPLIVTTTVQLFESLYAARTSRCRKLHNLVNSIIILDETQLLPAEQLNPIRHIIKALSEYYGVTFVLTTATPTGLDALHNEFGQQLLNGINSKEIIEKPSQYYQQLQRVKYILPDNFHKPQTWDEIAEQLTSHESVLAIVNKRDDAKILWQKMPEGTYHLSALMCGEHRSQIIEEIKQRLSANIPTRVISTQLVEAGVDFDFPVVFRALAGLDSIIQAGGRCNREGKLELGIVVVFVPPSKPPKGILTTAVDTTISLLTEFTGNLDAPEIFEKYFQSLFLNIKEHDKSNVLKKLQLTADQLQIQFRTAAMRFRMIDDDNMVSVYVYYGESEKWLRMLIKEKPQRWLLRKLQRYSVNIYQRQFNDLFRKGDIVEITPGFYAQSGGGVYSDETGLLVETPKLTPFNSVL